MTKSPGPANPGPPHRRNFLSRNPFLIIFFIVALVLLWNFQNPVGEVEMEYGTFRRHLDRMPVLHPEVYASLRGEPAVPSAPDVGPGGAPGIVELTLKPQEIVGKLRPDPAEDLPQAWQDRRTATGLIPFRTSRFPDLDDELVRDLRARGISFSTEIPTDWSGIWIWGLPILIFVFIMMMMFRSSRMTGENVLAFGRSRAKIVGEEKTGVTFQDVAGADEAKEELSEIVEFLRHPDRFTSLGGKIPKGVLLMGAPGCGKTLLARAVAGEAGVPFFSISGSDFVEMFVGVGAARVRDLFNTAKQKAPCIIFVDEIDAVGRHRGTGLGGGHDEREQTLNQLLVEMDGFDGRKGVIVVAATNRPDILDPALLRPGRFDRHVVLDAPDLRGREAILRIHARGKPLAADVAMNVIAQRTPGFSGADLANVMNEAALLAARRSRRDITMREIEEAVERVMAGPERRSRIIGPHEKRVLAYHELGHALVARFTPGADPVHKVSIIPRGKGALGYTLTLPAEDRYIVTKEELLARIRVTLGGRTAEEVVFGHMSTGAEDDLHKVTELARAIVCRWGMTEELGPVAYQQAPGNPFLGRDMSTTNTLSERTAALIDETIRKLIDQCHEAARKILMANRDLLDRLAAHLIEHEVLNLDEFEAAVNRFATTPPPPARQLARMEVQPPPLPA
jgi:cell division protease FtsH